uniref:Uncharacterized protein n=1 Tax=Magnetococcus massalia (strain MO-1) TaxID=451514 RepID=A0A1S7LLP9_MAGMO|nr:conserved protein of unknown function [Candidatus Magnetococcus massalia]
MEKILLFLTKEQLTAFQWRRGRIDGRPERFKPDEEGYAQFKHFMEEHKKAPCHVLVDLIEEHFRNDTMPHVLGPDRVVLKRRRAARAFAQTPYRHGVIQGSEKVAERREDKILLSGITEPEIITPWIELISEHGLLAGIHSLPMGGATLLKKIGVDQSHVLLVSLQSTSGLRFSFFDNRQLKMSRMAPVPEIDPEPYSKLMMAELEKTQRYISSLRLLPPGQPLQVVILSNRELLNTLAPHCEETALMKFQPMEVNEAAVKLGINREIKTPFSDSLFIQILGQKTPANHYAETKMLRQHRTRLANRMLYAASALALLVGVGVVGVIGFHGWQLQQEKQTHSQKMAAVKKRYQANIGKSVPKGVDPQEIKNIVLTAQTIKSMRSSPRTMMLALSEVLEGYDDFRLDSFEWWGATSDVMLKEGTAKKSTKRRRRSRRSKKSFDPAKISALDKAVLKGQITRIDDDFDHALRRFNDFVIELSRDKRIEHVKPLTIPRRPEEAQMTWSGSLKETKEETKHLSTPFAVEIKLRVRGKS